MPSSSQPADGLRLTRTGSVTELTLDRPQQRNSLSTDLVAALSQALEACTHDGTRLLVLRGAPSAFCAGFDLAGLPTETDDTLLARFVRVERLLQQCCTAPYATLAYAEGPAMGAGADLFAVCDHRYAGPGARFAFPGAAFGLVLGTRRLALRVGGAIAQRWVSGGERLNAEAAVAAGLATALLEDGGWPACLERHQQQADRLDAPTHASIVRASRVGVEGPDLAADLNHLVASAARPGIKARIEAYVQSSRPARASAEPGTARS